MSSHKHNSTAQHILRDAKIIIETIANQYSGDTLGEIDCEIKTHPDYPRSWIRDAAKDWLSKIPSDFGCEPTAQDARDMWSNECSLMCNAVEELAGLPHEPRPGWKNCIAKIQTIMHDLHRRANEERYSVEEIENWLMQRKNKQTCNSWCECIDKTIINRLNDPLDGIKAVRERNK